MSAMKGERRNRVSTALSARVRAALGGFLMVLAVSAAFSGRSAAQDEAETRRFAEHVLSLRTAGVAGADWVAGMLSMTGADEEGSRPALWRSFFENAIVGFEQAHSSAPTVLYYNPLLDVALLTVWKKLGERYGVASVRALPGERLGDPTAAVSGSPQWLMAEEGPVEALARIAGERFTAFRRAPSASGQRGTAADLRRALPRLVSNAAMRARWSEGKDTWLRRALARIEVALTAEDEALLMTAAPATDAETAQVLSSLPPSFVERLTLDMILEIDERERLLIISSPDDGDIYVFALCRLEAGSCALQRILLASLSE